VSEHCQIIIKQNNPASNIIELTKYRQEEGTVKTKEQYQAGRDVYCWLGFGIGFIGNVTRIFSPGFGTMLVLTALILNIVGCYNWAMSKGRSPLFCLWGVLAPIGFLGPALLQDNWYGRAPVPDVNP